MSLIIELRYRKPRDETRQMAFITISGVNSEVLEFSVGNIPIDLETDEDVLAHIRSREDELHLLCLYRVWKGADISRFRIEEKTELEAFLDWVDDGHRNIIGYEDEEEQVPIYEVISNHPFDRSHPPQFRWIENIENATGLEEVKAAIIQMLKDQI